MGILDIISGVLLIFTAVIIVVLVAMQEGKGGMGVISGESGERLGKNHAKTMNAMLARATKMAGIVLVVLTCAVTAINVYM